MGKKKTNNKNSTSEQLEGKIEEERWEREQLEEDGKVMLDKGKEHHKIQLLSIIGEIEGHDVLGNNIKSTKYEHILPMLAAIEDSDEIQGVLLLLNTMGGDVEAGLALAELIAGISKPTVSLVIGGGHSIGIPLAVSADYSFVAKSATMTLHPIRTTGTLITAEPTFEYMKKTQDRVVDFITEHSKAKRQIIEEKMNCTTNMANDVGTLLFGPEAVAIGLVDEVGTLHQALAKLRELCQLDKKGNME